MNALSPLPRRIVAVALLVLAAALPWQLVIRPILQAFDDKAEAIAGERRIVRRLEAQIRARPALEARLQAMGEEEGGGGEEYLAGDNDALAAAQLQSRVRAVSDAHGATLTSTQILDGSDVEGFRKLAVSVRLSTGIDGLQQILFDLESGSPVLFIDNLDIVAPPGGVMADRRDRAPVPLSVSINVSGYLPPGEARK